MNLILIGASTGGPGLLEKIVASLSGPICAPLIIAQHMDRISLHSFGKRLQRLSGIETTLVEAPTPIQNGCIYLLSDTAAIHSCGCDLSIVPKRDSGFYHPTIDRLFESAAKLECVRVTAILLSGIGADGAKGMLELKNMGHKTIAQDENSSIVYGMPKAAAEIGAASAIYPIEKIVTEIMELTKC